MPVPAAVAGSDVQLGPEYAFKTNIYTAPIANQMDSRVSAPPTPPPSTHPPTCTVPRTRPVPASALGSQPRLGWCLWMDWPCASWLAGGRRDACPQRTWLLNLTWPCPSPPWQDSLYLGGIDGNSSTFWHPATGLKFTHVGTQGEGVLISICRYAGTETHDSCCAGLDNNCDGKVRGTVLKCHSGLLLSADRTLR